MYFAVQAMAGTQQSFSDVSNPKSGKKYRC
jgi:hypothetical protein